MMEANTGDTKKLYLFKYEITFHRLNMEKDLFTDILTFKPAGGVVTLATNTPFNEYVEHIKKQGGLTYNPGDANKFIPYHQITEIKDIT